jgi:hypothetical protein
VYFCGWILTFRRNIRPPFSGLKFVGSGKVLVAVASYKERGKVVDEKWVNKGALPEPMGIYGKNVAFVKVRTCCFVTCCNDRSSNESSVVFCLFIRG